MKLWWLGPAFGILGFGVGAWLRHRWLAREAVYVDALIEQNAAKPIYEGTDEPLRAQTEERRRQAEAIKREARQVETRDDRASKIHLVG